MPDKNGYTVFDAKVFLSEGVTDVDHYSFFAAKIAFFIDASKSTGYATKISKEKPKRKSELMSDLYRLLVLSLSRSYARFGRG